MKSKRLTLVFLALLFFMSLFAESSKNVPAVTMVSYEQSWLDTEGTLALRNNLNEDIHNVVFQIIYLDMSDNPLDYEEFSKKVDIAPGMTKKIDIPAYEHDRRYHYYKTNDRGNHPAFKIKFKLKSYNEREVVDVPAVEDTGEINEEADDLKVGEGLSDMLVLGSGLVAWGFLIVFFVIAISVGLYVLVAVMAQRRNRSVVAWILISLIATPLLSIVLLLFIGKDRNAGPM